MPELTEWDAEMPRDNNFHDPLQKQGELTKEAIEAELTTLQARVSQVEGTLRNLLDVLVRPTMGSSHQYFTAYEQAEAILADSPGTPPLCNQARFNREQVEWLVKNGYIDNSLTEKLLHESLEEKGI